MLWRTEAQAFTEKQVALVKTFADQGAIAIENVRLFNETREALEKQTATAEILRVISSTPTDTQPVFEAIVRNATKLCESAYANVFRFDGEMLHWSASDGWPTDLTADIRANWPMRANRSRAAGRVILERQAVRVEDTRSDPEYDKDLAVALPYRRILGCPCCGRVTPSGVITVGWSEPGTIQQRHEDCSIPCRPGGDRNRELRLCQRDQGSARAADRYRRDPARDLRLPDRRAAVLDAIAERAARSCDAASARCT